MNTKENDRLTHQRVLRFGISLLTVLLLFILPSQESAAAGNANRVLTGVCGRHSTWKYNRNTKVLTISGRGAAALNQKGAAKVHADIRPKKLVVKPGITAITYHITDKEDGFHLLTLKKATLPDSLKAIKGPVFIDCHMDALTIPKNVKVLDAIPLLSSKIKKLRVHSDNKHFTVDKDGILFTKDKKKLVYYPSTAKAKTYRVPESVTNIGEMAFFVNPFLKNVILTKQIRQIGNGAFACCCNLKKINLQVTKIKQLQDYNGKRYGLHRYWNLEPAYDLSDNYEEGGTENSPQRKHDLAGELFGGYSYKDRKFIPSDNENYFGTFQGTKLRSFVMPDTLQYAGKQTVYPVYNIYADVNNDGSYSAAKWSVQPGGYESDWTGSQLGKIVIGKNFRGEINGGKSGSKARRKTLDLHFWGNAVVKGKSENMQILKTIQVHRKNKKYRVKDHVLYSKNMDTLYMAANTVTKNLTVSTKTRYIARGAFYNNATLQSIKLKGKINRVGQSAFEGCGNLKNVTFLKPVDRIEQSAFAAASRKMVLKGGKIRYIGAEAFAGTAVK